MLSSLRRLIPSFSRSHVDLSYRGGIPDDAAVTIRYLGTAGFVVTGGGRVVVLDPFVSRFPPWRALRRVDSDPTWIDRLIPEPNDVLVGHSHVDHILDAPAICLKHPTARFVGSESAVNLARAAGVSNVCVVKGHERLDSGPHVRIRPIPSLHGVDNPLPGQIPADIEWPTFAHKMTSGDVFDWHLTVDGVSIVHIDSANFLADDLRGHTADIVCLCAIGRHKKPGYTADILGLLKPKYVIPCHWDYFFRRYDRDVWQLRGVDLPGFVREIEACGVRPIVLPLGGEFGVPTPVR